MKLRMSNLCVIAISGVLAACHHDHSNATDTPPTYTVSGMVSGLTGAGLVLANNGVNQPVAASGSFSLAAPLSAGATYNVTIASQPASPAQICTVNNGSGVTNANVSNIAVTCVNVTYTISGTVSGLTGTGLILSNSGINLPIAAAGSFSLAAPLNAGAAYDLSVATQPGAPAQVCAVTNGAGVANANVSNISVTCVTTPLSIVSSTPASGATDVARTVAPALTFSAPLDGATVPGHVTFKRGTHTVAATFGSNASTLTVTPQTPLSLLTNYTIAADTGLHGSYAEPTAPDTSLSFTTRDGVWHPSELAKLGAPNTSEVQIAKTSDRNFVAVWHEYDGANANVWASTYVIGTGWEDTQQIQAPNNSDELNPRIAADGQGHAYVVWSQYDGTRSDVWYTRYTVGSGWGTATQLSATNVGVENFSPVIAASASGDVAIAWVNHANQDYAVWGSYLPANGVMGPSTRIETATGNTGDVRVAIDSAGIATAVWINYDTGDNTLALWANRCSGGTWGAGGIIENSPLSLSEYTLTVDSNDDVIAVWTQQITNNSQGVYVSRYNGTAGSWSARTSLAETVDGSAYYPAVAADADGDLMVVWGQLDSNLFHSYSRYYTAGGSWSPAVPIGAEVDPEIAFDASGNVLAVWGSEVSQVSRVIKSSRYTVAGGWSSATTLTPGPGAYDQYPKFAIDEFGNAVAVWVQYDLNNNTSNIIGSRFDDTPIVQ